MTEEKLQRHIGLFALAIYGIGDVLGAGIYGLIGRAAGEMGNAVWLAFVASMIAAGLTGLSYASLGSRFPKAGGSSYFVYKAFNMKMLSYVVGLVTLASGITSMATSSRAFSGYLINMLNNAVSLELVVVLFALFIMSTVIRGIRESMWVNVVCTFIELFGLLLIIVTGAKFLGGVDYLSTVTQSNSTGDISASLVLSGAVLTFYSFVGFEDMISVAEEVKEPEKNLPRAILIAISVSSAVYVIISMIAVSVMPSTELAVSTAPLVDVASKTAPWFPSVGFGLIAIFAVANTALLNFIMGSRLIYGMANQHLLPSFLGRINKRTKTPVNASLVLCALFLILALSGDISVLARSTSTLLLSCFLMVNLSLIILKIKKEKTGRFEVPMFVPVLGALVCVTMLLHTRIEEIKVAGVLLVGIITLYFIVRPSSKDVEEMSS